MGMILLNEAKSLKGDPSKKRSEYTLWIQLCSLPNLHLDLWELCLMPQVRALSPTDPTRQTSALIFSHGYYFPCLPVVALCGLACVAFFFSLLLSVFKAKYQGYPYRSVHHLSEFPCLLTITKCCNYHSYPCSFLLKWWSLKMHAIITVCVDWFIVSHNVEVISILVSLHEWISDHHHKWYGRTSPHAIFFPKHLS